MRLLARRRLTHTALAAVSRALPLQRLLPFAVAVPPPAAPSTALAAAFSAALTTEYTSSATASTNATSNSSPSTLSFDELSALTCELNSKQLLRQLRRSLDKLLRECFPPRLTSYGSSSHRPSRSRTHLKKSLQRITPPFLSNKDSLELPGLSSDPAVDTSNPTPYNPVTEFSLPSLRPAPNLSDATPKLASESLLVARKHNKESSSTRPKSPQDSSSSVPRFSSESSFAALKPITQSSLPSPKVKITESSIRASKSVAGPLEQRLSTEKIENKDRTSQSTLELFHSYIPLQSSKDLGVTSQLDSGESSHVFSEETSTKESDDLDPPKKIESSVSSFRSSLPILGLLSAAVAVAASRLPLSWLRFPSSSNPDSNEGTSTAPDTMSPDSPSPHPSTSHSPPQSASQSSPHSPTSVSPSLQSATPPPSPTANTSRLLPSIFTPETASVAPALEVIVPPTAVLKATPAPSSTVVPSSPNDLTSSFEPVPPANPVPIVNFVHSSHTESPAITVPALKSSVNAVPNAVPPPKTTVASTSMTPTECMMMGGLTGMTVMTATVATGVGPASSASTIHPMATRSDATTLTESWTATPWGSLTHVQPAAELAARAEVLAAAARMAAEEGVLAAPGPSNTKQEPVRNETQVLPKKSRNKSDRSKGSSGSPETVVLLAPRELQDSQHAPPLKMQNSSWRRLSKVRSRSSSGRTSTGTGEERKHATRSSSSDRLAPQLLHSLPAPLLTRILTKNFAGVEMAALRGACRPLHLAGSCALRSSLWSLRRDLEVRAVRLQVALRRAQSMVADEVQQRTVGPPTEGRPQSPAQDETRMLLVSLILLEEVRGELDVLAAHASAWPQAGTSSRLVGLLAGSVLDEGRRLLRLLPFPFRPQTPSRATPFAASKPRRHKSKGQDTSSNWSTNGQQLDPGNSNARFSMPSLGAASAADAVCSFSARLSEMLATEATVADAAAGRVGGSAAAALGSCALALLEHCACADAMMVVTVGGGNGTAQEGETVSATASGDSLSQSTDLHPDTVQVLAVYEARALEDVPQPWPPVSNSEGRRRGEATEPPAAVWLRDLGKAVRQQRRRVASARVETVYGSGSTETCHQVGVGLEGEPHRRSQLVALPGGGARHLLERRWPSAWTSRALPGRSVRMMMELRCGRSSAPPVLRPLLSPVQPCAANRDPSNATPGHDPGAFAFFAWRTPEPSHHSNNNCSMDGKD